MVYYHYKTYYVSYVLIEYEIYTPNSVEQARDFLQMYGWYD